MARRCLGAGAGVAVSVCLFGVVQPQMSKEIRFPYKLCVAPLTRVCPALMAPHVIGPGASMLILFFAVLAYEHFY
jgi:hypothetical protein